MNLGVLVKIVDNTKRVEAAAKKASIRSLSHFAGATRKTAIESFEESDDPSEPGTPPHTRIGVFKQTKFATAGGSGIKGKNLYARGKSLPGAIRFNVNRKDQIAVVGPTKSKAGPIGRLHEFGGRRGNARYPARPFMEPAMKENAPRFVDSFRGSIGE